jgi:hypothetical protein
MPPDDFWKQTPRLILAITEAKIRDRKRAQTDNAVLAYQTARLGRIDKFPQFKTVLKDFLPSDAKSSRTEPLPWQKGLEIARQWMAALAR